MARRIDQSQEMETIAIVPEMDCTDPVDLGDKKVLIVGGTFGVGEALAHLCLERGAEVEVVGLEENPTLSCKQHILDVVDEIDSLEDLFREKDYVFNNIGMIGKSLIIDTSPELLKKFLRVNVETMFRLIQYSIRHIKEVAVHMSTRPDFSSHAEWSLYESTKHTIIDLTKAAAEEGFQKHYAFCPSRIDTAFRDSVCPEDDKRSRMSPKVAAGFIIDLFNGKNPSGSAYWVRRVY